MDANKTKRGNKKVKRLVPIGSRHRTALVFQEPIPSSSTDIDETVPDIQITQQSQSEVPEVRSTPAVTTQQAEEYNMNHRNRGKAVIFNHENFEIKEAVRVGSQVDVERLTNVLTKLHFDVQVHDDLDFSTLKRTVKELCAVRKQLKEEGHSENDCLLIVVLSHGQESSQIAAKDVYYPLDYLWEPFTGNDCLSLAGKPKLFFIVACRGTKVDEGVRMTAPTGSTVTDATVSHSYKIPKQADFLIAQSTVEGYYSYREPTDGTWFVKSLCEVLEECHETTDLLKMLTITARKVAVGFVSNVPDVPEFDQMTQVPSVTTRLLRDVYFRPKNS